jgi:hypothetical protein
MLLAAAAAAGDDDGGGGDDNDNGMSGEEWTSTLRLVVTREVRWRCSRATIVPR